ncbi:MAG: hypothetical protein M3O20_14915 [Acidobacteriota bacterium]|nr:hypothetical protein [Acidobacteriota bacterium]
MLLSFAQFIQQTAFFTELRGSGYVYPVILSLHMVTIALFGGMILMTDMRLLGWAMRSYPLAEVIDQFRTPKRVGFVIMITLGVLMACCKAEEYYYNDWFHLKLALLVLVGLHALIFRRGVYSRAAKLDHARTLPAGAKLAGVISLVLWIGIACAGRGIGYIEPPLDKIHAGVAAPHVTVPAVYVH